jgi:hypothetical protein
MDEVKPCIIHINGKMLEIVEPCLLGAPVKIRPPITYQIAQRVGVRAIVPSTALNRIGQSGPLQTVPQIVERRLGNVDHERFNHQGLLRNGNSRTSQRREHREYGHGMFHVGSLRSLATSRQTASYLKKVKY